MKKQITNLVTGCPRSPGEHRCGGRFALLSALFLFACFGSLRAQCVVEETSPTGSFSGNYFGQSFTTTCAGEIATIRVQGDISAGTMTLRSGNGCGGSVVGSATFTADVGNNILATFSPPVPVAANSVYTYYFAAPGSLPTTSSTNPYPGGNFYYGVNCQNNLTGNDMHFTVTLTAPSGPACTSYTNTTTASGLGANGVVKVFATGNNVYAATFSGLSISTDGGVNFTNYTTANGLGNNTVQRVFADGTTVYASTHGGGVSVTTNGGTSFTNYTTANGMGSDLVRGVFASGSNIYAATLNGLAISINGGTSFTNKTTADGLGNNTVYGVYVANGVIYAATNGGVSISTNGGTSFTNKTTADGLGSNVVVDVYAAGNNVYAGTSNGLAISTNGGTSFTNKTTADGLGANYTSAVYAIGSTVYAATNGGLGISTNGGTSFTNYTGANGLGSNNATGVFADANKIYVGTTGGLSSCSTCPEPTTVSYVKPGGTGNGGSWACATGDLQAAINTAGITEVWVAEGTYKPAAYPTGCVGCSTNRDFAFLLKNNVKVYGGFDGTETALSQRNIAANPTILSGDIGTAGDPSDNCVHVVFSVENNSGARLDGFTISGGNANVNKLVNIGNGILSARNGGGMLNYASEATVRNCTFSGNQALHLGGGIFWEEFSPLTVDSCIFNANKTGNALGEVSAGGAAYFSTTASSNLIFTHCDFTDNRANVQGGALAFLGVDSIFAQNCTFTRDSAGFGGAVYLHSEVDSMDVTFQNCVFDENAAVQIDPFQFGTSAGAISAESQYNPLILNLDSCQFTGNKTDQTGPGIGGAIWARAANFEPADLALNLNNSVFSGNEAAFGGAVQCDGETVSVNLAVDSCTFENNLATGHAFSTGGAISISALVVEGGDKPAGEAKSLVLTQTLSLTNSLFEGNSAFNLAGAVSVGGDVEATMDNCDFLFNSAGASGDEFSGGGALLLSNLGGSTLTGCDFNDNSSETAGGAIQLFGTTTLTVDSCNFARDTANLGGAVYFQSEIGAQDAYFTHCIFTENVAHGSDYPGGGAIYANAAANDIYVSVDSCSFTGNLAEGGNYASGGAIFGETTDAAGGGGGGGGGRPELAGNGKHPELAGETSGEKSGALTVGYLTYLIAHSNFSGNRADDGGAIILSTEEGNFNYEVDSCTFSNNLADDYAGGGAAFYAGQTGGCTTCTATFDDCIFENNESAFVGGGLYAFGDAGFTLDVNRSVFASNSAAEYGGGFHDDDGTSSTFNNCLFYDNSCEVTGTGDGGGAISTYSDLTVNNCTFFGNSSQSVGGAIASLYFSYDLFVNNSVFWGNTAPGGGEQIAIGSTTNEMVNFSTVEGATVFPGTSNSNADPSFRDAAFPKGADNLWATADDGLALNCFSTAVNSGSNAAIPAGVTQDLKRANRIQNTTVDRGAYENLVPSFYITGLTVGNISACNGQTTPCTTDDTFTADVTVTYSGAAFTTLALSGSDLVGTPPTIFNPGASPYTFTGVTLRADGQPIRLTATFTGFPQCPFTNNNAGTAASCGAQVPCPLTFTGLDAAYCDFDDPVTLVGSLAPGGYFLGDGITDLGNGTATFDPAAAPLGERTVYYFFNEDLNGGAPWASADGGLYHSVGLKTDGTLWAWGGNEFGQLGNGTNTGSNIPVQIGSATNWASVAAGVHHVVALKTDGTLWAWGYNGSGQLGNGTNDNSNVPVQVGSASNWASVSSKGSHNLALKTDGTLWAWGANFYGQVGNGSSGSGANVLAPVQIGVATDWASIGAGGSHSLAIKTGGTLWAWGYNLSGQLGTGNNNNSNVPVQVGAATDWESATGGAFHTLGLKTDGTLWSWGYNTSGQLGNGNNSDTNTPAQVGTDNDWSSATGASFTHALKTDGTLWSWGYNGEGALGNGNNTSINAPAQTGTDDDWTGVFVGTWHSLALKNNGFLLTTGWNEDGQLGDGTRTDKNVFEAVVNASGSQAVTVSFCPEFTGLDATYCANEDAVTLTGNYAPEGEFTGTGITDNGDGTATFDPGAAGAGGDIIYSISTSAPWTSVSAGYYHTLARKSDGTLWGWGYNYYGTIGDGTSDDSNVPVQTIGNGWADASAGYYHSLGVKTDGTLWGWGTNYYGEIGTGGDTETPVQIGTATNWAQVEAGYYRSFAIKTDGTLWAFGYNGGVFGTGNSTDSNVPVQIGTATNWASLSTHNAADHVLAIRTDGTLWVWGEGIYGQLGTGNNSNQLSPVQIGSATDWATAAVGDYHSLAIKTDGTLWVWGYGGDGELGLGNYADSNVPVQVTGSWSSIAGGYDCTLATKTDGTLWGWGYNGYGQLGNGTYDDSNVPVQSGVAVNWSAVATSSDYYFSFGLRSDGNLYGWGANDYGYLGDGTYDETTVPVLIGDPISSVSTTQTVTVSAAPNGISLENVSAADCQNTSCTTDDTYVADVVVTYASKPTTGTLSLTGVHIIGIVMPVEVASIGATSHTFTDVTMLADGDDVDLTAAFSNGCEYNDDEVATAPGCGGGGFTPTNIEVTGFTGCTDLNGTYTFEDYYLGAPYWVNGIGSIYWDGDFWIIDDGEGYVASNETGNVNLLPCTGWEGNSSGCGTPTLSGGCGALGGGGGTACAITDIEIANESACNDNGTTDASDDYFTADITVTFAYAPANGTLIVDYGGAGKPGSANKSMVGLDEEAVAGLQCVTTFTFEDVQLVADGEFFGLIAYFSDATCEYEEGSWEAPASCSCVPTTAFTACPGNLSGNTEAGTCARTFSYDAVANGTPAATYSYVFTGATTGTGSGTGSGSSFNRGVTNVVITAENDCGSTTCTFSVTVTDNEKPDVVCKNHVVALVGGAVNIAPANVHQSSSDNCGTVNLVTVSPYIFTCGEKGQNQVTLTVNDGNGNTKTCTATVTVQDLTPPVANCKNISVNLGANGSALIIPQQVNNVSTDNCPGVMLVSVAPSSFNCNTIGAQTVTLTVKDAVNQTSTCTATVTVQDVTKPNAKCHNVTLDLNASGQATLSLAQVNNASTDNCGIASMSLSKTNFNCTNVGANTVSLLVTDVHGNTATCNSAVTVRDLIAPAVTCQTALTISLNSVGIASLTPSQFFITGTDNCGIGSQILVPNSLDCGEVGTSNVVLHVNDGNGNTTTCTTSVTVPPFVEIQSVTVIPDTCNSGVGSVEIQATTGGGQLGYSLNNGGSWQLTNTFEDLPAGTYQVAVIAFGASNCIAYGGTVTLGNIGSDVTWYKDVDGDGYTDGVTQVSCLQPAGFVASAQPGDCDDSDPLEFPGQTWFRDMDNDSYSNGQSLVQCTKPTGYKLASQLTATTGDCNDSNANIKPGAPELCNNLDDDCDTQIDEGISGATYVGNFTLTTQAQVNAFPTCISILQGNLTVQNASVTSLAPLANLIKVTGSVTIKLTSLVNMNGLHNLDTIGGTLNINTNNNGSKLQSLDGLEDLDWVGGALKVFSNNLLSDCCAIEDLVEVEPNGTGGTISIYSNLTGCDNQAQVQACSTFAPPGGGTEEIGDIGNWGNWKDVAASLGAENNFSLSVFPNPLDSRKTLTVQVGGDFEQGSLRIFDVTGRLLVSQVLETNELRLSATDWKPGIYLVQTVLDGKVFTEKLFVE